MTAQLKGKRALVTGGKKCIKFAICQGLITQGFEVIMAARSLDKAKAASEKLQSSNVVSRSPRNVLLKS